MILSGKSSNIHLDNIITEFLHELSLYFVTKVVYDGKTNANKS
ncbi:hypothetical protein NUACC26_099660 [Scytonema sp. NUACC26]